MTVILGFVFSCYKPFRDPQQLSLTIANAESTEENESTKEKEAID
jgi:hypothetical protein